MAEKSKTVHVVELKASAKHLQETLVLLKKSFDGMVLPPDLDKTFTKLENALGSILRKTEKEVIPREDFQDTEKEITKIKNAFDGLSDSIDGIKKANDKKLFSMLPGDTVQKLESAKKAYIAYSTTLASVVKAEEALTTAQEKKQLTEEKATGASNSERVYKGKVTLAKKELAQYQEITDALKEQAEATEALANAQKELEEVTARGARPETIAKRQTTVDKATVRKTTADAKVGGFTKKDLKARADAIEKVRVATEKYEAAQKASESATKAKTAAEVAAQTAANNLARVQNKNAEDSQKEAQALSALKIVLEAVDPKYKDMAVKGKTAGEQLEFLRKVIDNLSDDELVKLKTQLGGVDKSFDNTKESLEDLKQGLQQTKEKVEETDEAFEQQQAFENKIKQFLGLSGAAQLLRSALRDALQTITELDATMTEMAVVTDLTVGDYWDQLPEYSQRASELGVSINSAYKAATLYYQQGLKSNEVTAISAETLKLAKIAGIDAAEATDKMTAALRGFNMELNDTSAQRVADVYSQLAAITAADVDEISSAMTKTASIASSAGMEFETTAAFLAQIVETTRESAETAGTAMKTVIARFQELKKDPAEIGEVDGEIVDANKIETALRSVGVALRDNSGQFRELDDVFLELSSKWNTLDTNTQRYIATIAAGSRQQSRFIAMMQDYARTQELVTAANTSAGASQKQFEKTMDSLEAKVEKLKNAWHEFTMGIMDSDLVKFGVDVLTKFLEVINKATSAFDGIGGSLAKIISIVTVFKIGSTIFDKLKQPLIDFFSEIVKKAGEAGYEAGRAAKEGLKKAKEDNATPEPNSNKDVKGKGKYVSGWSKFTSGRKALKENRNKDGVIDPEKNVKAWNELREGIQQVGREITNVGVAFSAFGGILSSLGLEETGEGFAKFGNVLMIGGGVISSIIPLISLLGITVDKESNKMVIAGIKTQLAWWWVMLIVGAIAAAITGIILLARHLQSISPEGKLKAAKEEAEAVKTAAEEAAESFDRLNDSLDSLSEKEETLKTLTKGSEEWKEQVRGINSEVLDLIKEYPKLAKIVKNTGGVLSIDKEAKENADDALSIYDQIIQEAEMQKIFLQVSGQREDLDVAKAQIDVDRNNYFGTEGLSFDRVKQTVEGVGREAHSVYYRETDNEKLGPDVRTKLSNQQIDILAKAMVEGDLTDKTSEAFTTFFGQLGITKEQFAILEEDIEKYKDQLYSYGKTLLTFESQQEIIYDSLAQSVLSTSEAMARAEGRINQLFNIVDGEDYKEAEKEVQQWFDTTSFGGRTWDEAISESNGTDATDAIKAAIAEEMGMNANEVIKNAMFEKWGYQNARITKDGQLEYQDADNKWVTEDLSHLEEALTQYMVKLKVQQKGEEVAGAMDVLYTGLGEEEKRVLDKALTDETGSNLTQSDIATLKEIKTKTNNKELQNEIGKAIVGATAGFQEKRIAGRGVYGATVAQAGALTNLVKGMSTSQQADFIDQFNIISRELTQEQREQFIASIAGMSSDPTALDKWQEIIPTLEQLGVEITPAMKGFVNGLTETFGARYSSSWLKQMGVSDDVISQYEDAINGGTKGDTGPVKTVEEFNNEFKEWRDHYEKVNDEDAKNSSEFTKKVVEALAESYEKEIDALEQLSNAVTEANDRLISKIQEQIQADRQARENQKTEQELTNNLNKLSYLAMDTSGGNALEILGLGKSNAEAEQNYQDSLVDQAISKLEDANAKAAEQREQQIAIARAQLDAYINSPQIVTDAEDIIKKALETPTQVEGTTVLQLLTPQGPTTSYEDSQLKLEILQNLSTWKSYKTGGLADFTGPAWLDGTPSKPEYILNANQTERLFSLIDVLEGFNKGGDSTKANGDNYFDININVEKLDNDYDVEQVADKIRRMIYDDATYRNVNSINHIR